MTHEQGLLHWQTLAVLNLIASSQPSCAKSVGLIYLQRSTNVWPELVSERFFSRLYGVVVVAVVVFGSGFDPSLRVRFGKR